MDILIVQWNPSLKLNPSGPDLMFSLEEFQFKRIILIEISRFETTGHVWYREEISFLFIFTKFNEGAILIF